MRDRYLRISRAKKSSSRVNPCCENPTSSGFASGNGPACATLITMPTTMAVVIMSVFIVFSLEGGSSSRLLFNLDVRRSYTSITSARATSQVRVQGIRRAAAIRR